MAFVIDAYFQDGMLERIRDTIVKMALCNAEPTTFTEANVTFNIAEVAGLDSTDFPLSGTAPNRTCTSAAQTLTASATDTATHLALVDTVNSRYIAIPITSYAVTDTNDYDVASFTIACTIPTAA